MVYLLLLMKDLAGTKIHRFRNIALVELDRIFFTTKVWAKNMGNIIQTNDTLNKSQNAQKEQVAQNSVLNKRSIYDLQLLMREEAFQSDNYAMRCYD